MDIEKVRLVRTLKAGKRVWVKGEVLTAPLPKVIIQEVMAKTGLVEVLAMKKPEPLLKPKESDQPSTATTFGKSTQALLRPEEMPEGSVEAPPVIKKKKAKPKATRKLARKKLNKKG